MEPVPFPFPLQQQRKSQAASLGRLTGEGGGAFPGWPARRRSQDSGRILVPSNREIGIQEPQTEVGGHGCRYTLIKEEVGLEKSGWECQSAADLILPHRS